MKLDLRRIAAQPGQTLPFHFALDLSGLEWNGTRPAPWPIEVEGTVRNRAGALVLQAELKGRLSLVCDRCAQPFTREKTVDYETLAALELEDGDQDEIVLADRDGQLDLEKLMGEVFVLHLDTKNLCSPDCKGLCPGCGADLNQAPCRCKKEVDPRLAKLAQLLEED